MSQSKQVHALITKARQKSDFDAVVIHYGCSEAEVEEMKSIANANRADARECFAYLAGQIRRKAAA